MKKKTILEILYSVDERFLLKYFKLLNNINLYYSEELKQKKYLSKIEFNKIKKHSNFLLKKEFKNLLKKNYTRGYYFEFEKSFIKECGIEIAGKMHIGRSRNELDSCIARMMMRSNLVNFSQSTLNIIKTLVQKFSDNNNYFPYFTQNQPASFIKINHYFNNVILSTYDYLEKILIGKSSIYFSPLGACGLNGSDFNLNYKKISKNLKFRFMEKNSIKSISDYEYLIYYVNLVNIVVVKLSRMFHDFIFFQSYEIGYIKFNKEYAGKSSYFPHKSNPYLIEKCLSLSNELINYNNLLSNGLRKTINSNSYEFKNLIFQTDLFFEKFSDFANISVKVVENINFNINLINDNNYDFLYISSLQNQIISTNKKANLRTENSNLNKLYSKNHNLEDVINYVKKKYPESFKNLNLKKFKKKINKFNQFGYGSNDRKATFTKKKHYGIIKFLENKINKL